MSLRLSNWLIFAGFFFLPMVPAAAQVTSSLYDSAHTYREVTANTDGCPTANHLCHYHPGMNGWGDDSPAKEYNYRGFNGSNVVEFMNWRMIFPVGYKWDHSQKYPMIIMLHGSGESGRIGSCCFGTYSPSNVLYDNNDDHLTHGGREHQVAAGYSATTGLPSGTVKFPGIVVWPQSSYNGSWEAGWNNGALADDNRMAAKILEWIITHYDVDPDRVVIHGLSSGARGTWDLAAKRPDLFAAILPMSGVSSNNDVMTDILVTTPVWLFQGGTDTNPNPGSSQQLIDLLNAKGGKGIRTVYPTVGHDTWFKAYAEPNFFPFILSANKKNIYVFGGDPIVCPGGTLKLGFSAGFKAYQWTRDGADIPGATSRFYNATVAGNYAVKYTRVTDNSIATSFVLRVDQKTGSTYVPVVTNTGSVNLTIDIAGATNTVALTAPSGYPTYNWLKNHTVVATTSTNARTVSTGSGTASDAGTYTVKVVPPNACSSIESNPVNITWNSPQPVSPKPDVPTFVKSPTSVQLTWNSMPNEAGFEVWRKQLATTSPLYSAKPYALLITLPAGTNSYTDQTLQTGGQYQYRVRAIHPGSSATFSNETLVVADPENTAVERKFNVNLTWAWNKQGGTWNDFVTTGGGVVGNSMTLADTTGVSSFLTISVSAPFVDGANNHGVGTGVYPTQVMKYFLRSTTTQQGVLKLSGLKLNKVYDVSILCSNADVWYPSDTKLTIGGQTATVNAKGNGALLANFTALVPNSTGELTIAVAPATTTSTNVGVINAMVIKERSTSANAPPVVQAGPDRQITLPYPSLQLTGASASDPDGTIASLLWSQKSGPAITISNGTTLSPTLTDMAEGTHVLELQATDNGGASSVDQVIIQVSPAPAVTSREFDINVTWAWNKQAAQPWNDFVTTNGGSVGNTMTLVDKDGNSSGISITVTAPFVDGANNHGVTPGLYPNNVMKYYLRSTTSQAGALKFAGLNVARQYDLSIMSSNTDVWYPSDTRLTVAGQSLTVNAKGNANLLVNFVNVVPTGSGEIAITVAPATTNSTNVGVINAIILTEHDGSNPGARTISELTEESTPTDFVHIFPNAIDDQVTVEITASAPASEAYSVEFTDLNGTRVHQLELESREGDSVSQRISADFLQTGMYIVIVRSRQHGTRYVKVLKK